MISAESPLSLEVDGTTYLVAVLTYEDGPAAFVLRNTIFVRDTGCPVTNQAYAQAVAQAAQRARSD